MLNQRYIKVKIKITNEQSILAQLADRLHSKRLEAFLSNVDDYLL